MTLISSNPSTPEGVVSLAATAPRSIAATEPPIAIGAGHDETIPRTFLALADIGALVFAFIATGFISPWVQWLLLPSGPLRLSLPEWMSLPGGPSFNQFPPLTSVAWVLIVTSPITVLFMELLRSERLVDFPVRQRGMPPELDEILGKM